MKKILIIGGGFAGCSSAEITSRLPNTKITLIEHILVEVIHLRLDQDIF